MTSNLPGSIRERLTDKDRQFIKGINDYNKIPQYGSELIDIHKVILSGVIYNMHNNKNLKFRKEYKRLTKEIS